MILLLNSSMLQIFFSVCMSFFTNARGLDVLDQRIPLQIKKDATTCFRRKARRRKLQKFYFRISIEPPAASMADLAFSLTALMRNGSLALISPLPNTLILSVRLISP